MIVPGEQSSLCAFIIADGMGGHNCGEIASRMAVEHVGEFIRSNSSRFDLGNIREELRSAVEQANSVVYEKSMESEELNGMGTTLIAAVVCADTLTAAHVGDSRLYLVRDGEIHQLTQDHSYIGELLRNGTLTREEAENHPRRNIITRAVGCAPEILVDLISQDIKGNDIFVLCTDGLTNMISESEISGIVRENEPEEACMKLIEAANRKGGDDNITVIVIKCE